MSSWLECYKQHHSNSSVHTPHSEHHSSVIAHTPRFTFLLLFFWSLLHKGEMLIIMPVSPHLVFADLTLNPTPYGHSKFHCWSTCVPCNVMHSPTEFSSQCCCAGQYRSGAFADRQSPGSKAADCFAMDKLVTKRFSSALTLLHVTV